MVLNTCILMWRNRLKKMNRAGIMRRWFYSTCVLYNLKQNSFCCVQYKNGIPRIIQALESNIWDRCFPILSVLNLKLILWYLITTAQRWSDPTNKHVKISMSRPFFRLLQIPTSRQWLSLSAILAKSNLKMENFRFGIIARWSCLSKTCCAHHLFKI